MTKKKTDVYMSVSVLLVGFLIGATLFHTSSTHALPEENNYTSNLDSFNRSIWAWDTIEVVSTESTTYSQDPGTPNLFLNRHFGAASSAEGGFRFFHQPSLREKS